MVSAESVGFEVDSKTEQSTIVEVEGVSVTGVVSGVHIPIVAIAVIPMATPVMTATFIDLNMAFTNH